MQTTLADALSLTREAFSGEVWRLWTGHLVHYSPSHLALNALAAIPPLLIARPRWRFVAWALIAAPLISVILLLNEPRIEYRGVSALILGAWFIAALARLETSRRIAVALMVVAAFKLAGETLGLMPWNVGVASSLLAHWCGALLGIAGGLLGRSRAGRRWDFRS